MQVVILCGGLGTRLKSSTPNLPKALHRVNQKTILEWQIRKLPSSTKEILLLIGSVENHVHYEDEVKHLESKYGYPIAIFTESKRLGTAGALLMARKKIRRKFIVVLGDVIFDGPIDQLFESLRNRDLLALWIRETDHPMDSDLVLVNPDASINRILKYPHNIDLSKTNPYGLTGIIAMRRKFLKFVPPGTHVDISEVLSSFNTKIVKRCRPIVSLNSFMDIGTPERFSKAGELIDMLERKQSANLYVLDRDDTLIFDTQNYQGREITFNNGLIAKIAKEISHDSDCKVILVTNQPGIAKGFKTYEQVLNENNEIVLYLKNHNLNLNSVKFCPHHPKVGFEGEIRSLKVVCRCRKPYPGLVIDAVRELNLNPTRIKVIGDSEFDYSLSKLLSAEFSLARFKREENCFKTFFYRLLWHLGH